MQRKGHSDQCKPAPPLLYKLQDIILGFRRTVGIISLLCWYAFSNAFNSISLVAESALSKSSPFHSVFIIFVIVLFQKYKFLTQVMGKTREFVLLTAGLYLLSLLVPFRDWSYTWPLLLCFKQLDISWYWFVHLLSKQSFLHASSFAHRSVSLATQGDYRLAGDDSLADLCRFQGFCLLYFGKQRMFAMVNVDLFFWLSVRLGVLFVGLLHHFQHVLEHGSS